MTNRNIANQTVAKVSTFLFAGGWFWAAASAVFAAPLELHVAPNGADTNPGPSHQ